jgi:hypothetical protein
MTAGVCGRCGALLDPDGTCFACAYDPGPLPAEFRDHETRGGALLDEVHAFLCGYVVFPSAAAAVAATLWAAHTHLVGQFESTPRLALLSPEKQCGKSRTLELLELLCAAPRPCRTHRPPTCTGGSAPGP